MAQRNKEVDDQQDSEPLAINPLDNDDDAGFFSDKGDTGEGYFGDVPEADVPGILRPEQTQIPAPGSDFNLPEQPVHEPGRPDPEIKKDLIALLRQRGDVDDTRVTVEVLRGEVTLTGQATRQTKRMSEKLAVGVAGVHSVRNQIEEQTE